MSSEAVISITNLSKAYRIWRDPSARLKAPLVETFGQLVPPALRPPWLRNQLIHDDRTTPYYRDFHALQDINFEVLRGESVGIIGRNGSGKSTLLKIIAGTLRQTSGQVSVKGRIAALLELGSGFNPDFTGHENIYLNAALLGLTREEIDDRLESIISFADIGDFIHQPVKTYSSGMMIRLAFAVQTAVDPDILIVDEALSVGDYFFTQKCFRRINEMREKGLTLLFVSHDMGSVRDLCTQAICLHQGRSIYQGDAKKAINVYMNHGSVAASSISTESSVSHVDTVKTVALGEILADAIWKSPRETPAAGMLYAVLLMDEGGRPTTTGKIGDTLIVRVYYSAPPQEVGAHLSIVIKNRYDHIITSTRAPLAGGAVSHSHSGISSVDFKVTMMIEAGFYSFLIKMSQPTAPNRGNALDTTEWLGPIEIRWDYETDPAPFLGMFGVPITVRHGIT